MMDKELKTKWVKALRSGRYKQGRTQLHNPKNNTYCCLGVLADVAGYVPNKVKRRGEEYLSKTKEEEFGLDYDMQVKLGQMNDGSFGAPAYDFKQIAAFIQKEL
jgi:hypothetical protein